MNSMDSKELDTKSKRILEALYELGGSAKSSEVKEWTGIEKNGVLHYRVNKKLEPLGFIKTKEDTSSSASLPPKILKMTDKGTEYVEDILDDGADIPVSEEVEHLRKEVKKLRETVYHYEGHLDEMEDTLEQYRSVYGDVDEVRRIVDRAEGVDTDGPLLEEVTIEDLGEELSKKWGDVEGFIHWQHTQHVAVSQMLSRLEDAGLVTLSEGFREELEVDRIDSNFPEPDRMRIDPGPAIEDLPDADHDAHHTEDVDFIRDLLETKAGEVRDGFLSFDDFRNDDVETVNDLERLFSEGFGFSMLNPGEEELVALASEFGLDLEDREDVLEEETVDVEATGAIEATEDVSEDTESLEYAGGQHD